MDQLRIDQGVSRVRAEDIEAALAQIGEIKAARVVADADGRIQEIHVLALPSKAPKQLVRDIESTIMASFGVPVDHRKISIAQLGREMAEATARAIESGNGNGNGSRTSKKAAEKTSRPRIKAINASVSGLEASASVTIEANGKEFVGASKGAASATGRLRQVAAAALDAVGQYLDGKAMFTLEDVALVDLGRSRVAVASVTLVTEFGEENFSGSALVRQNESDSIVRATLDAINRRIGLLTTE